MKVLLVPNLKKTKTYECTCEIINFLNTNNCQCFMDSKFTKFKNYKGLTLKPIEDIIEECDITVAIGGDGTIIQCAKYSIKSDNSVIPIERRASARLGPIPLTNLISRSLFIQAVLLIFPNEVFYFTVFQLNNFAGFSRHHFIMSHDYKCLI